MHTDASLKTLLLEQLEKFVIVLDEDQIVYANALARKQLGLAEGEQTEFFSNYLLNDDVLGICNCNSGISLAGELHMIMLKLADKTVKHFRLLKKTLNHEGRQLEYYQECDVENCELRLDYERQRQDAILNMIPDLMFLLDEHLRIIEFHSIDHDSLLDSSLSFLGKPFTQSMPEHTHQVISQALEQARQNGYMSGAQYWLEQNGQERWWEISVRCMNLGESLRYVVMARDITQTRKDALALAESEAMFRTVAEQGRDGLAVADKNGLVVHWNRSMETITGLRKADVAGKPISQIMFSLCTPEQQQLPGAFEQLDERINRLLSKQDLHWLGQTAEQEIIRPDGTKRLVSSVLFPIEFDNQYLIGAWYSDITEQRIAELALVESEAYIRTLFYDSPVPVLVVEVPSLTIFDLNHAAIKAFGVEQREAIEGKNIRALLPEDPSLLEEQQTKLKMLLEKETNSVECHFIRHGAEIWDARVYAFNISLVGRDLIQLTLIDTTAHNKAMQALFESESRYRAVAENANAGIGIFDLDERVVFANDTLAEMLGYSRQELIGLSMSTLVSTETFDLFRQKTIERQHGKIDRYEASMMHKDGRQRHFSISASPLFSAGKELTGTLGVLIDITEQKEAQQLLFETGERLKAILASMPDMIFIHDRDGRYLDSFINRKLYPNIEYQPKNGQLLNEVFETDTARDILLAIRQCLQRQETVEIQFDYNIGSNLRHLQARLSPMGDDRVVSVVRDTTLLITLEKEIIHNNNLLRVLTQLATRFINLPVSDIEVEINRAISEIGQFAEVDRVYIFDYDWEANTMSNTYEWCSEGTSPEIDNLKDIPNSFLPDWVASHKRGEMTYVPRVSELDPDDNLRKILEPQQIQSLVTIPLMDGEVCLGYVGFDAVKNERIFTDSEISLLRIFAELLTNLKIKQITEQMLHQNKLILQRQNEQLVMLNEKLRQQNDEIMQKNRELDIERERALASDRLKTAFLNNVSHEVRTPLNGIVGFAQFLADDSLSAEDKQEFISALNSSVNRLTDTINDIMDASLLMSGNMNVHHESFRLDELLQEVLRKYQYDARAKGLKISIKPEPGNVVVITDQTMTRRILEELVGNAVKYTNKGQVNFGAAANEGKIILTVADTGKGISEEALPRIWEPFMQEDVSTTRTFEGSGLGLTIVKGFVTLLGGQIEVQSKTAMGSTFTITLQDLNQENARRKAAEDVDQKTSSSPVILIAEDEALNVLYLKRVFRNKDVVLHFASNGREALEMAENIPDINLVFMDIKMPVMDGLEATRRIKTIRPKLPVVAVTAYAASEDRQACFEAGCDEYIAKPFTPEDLDKMIRRYTTGKIL
ncbi:MAG TPA: PAS domain S-box protein [Bacteroidales bacterium]|nr:PAS domain S-box protein [Bacteroidales bacterium]